MSRNNKKVRWNVQLFLRNMFIVGVLAFVVYSIYINVTKPKTSVFQVSYQNIALESQHRALIMRNETSVSSYNSGIFKPSVVDGERVAKGQIVGQLKIEDVEVNQAEAQSEQLPIIDQAALENDVETRYNDLILALRNDDYILAKSLKNDLEMKLDRLSKVVDASGESAYQDAIMQVDQVGSENAQTGQVIDIPTSSAGIVSYYYDGYESVINYPNRYKIDYQTLFEETITPSNQHLNVVQRNAGIFKVVSNLSWYLACRVDLEVDADFIKNSDVLVTVNGKQVKGKIEDVFQAGNDGIVIIKMSQYLDGVHRMRSVDIDVRRDEVRGIKIPDSAVVERSNQIGVLSVDLNGVLSFKPIKKLADGDGFIVVQEGNFQVEAENGERIVRYSVSHGDKIALDAENYKEGDIVE
ncbi:MAG: hypothetical protein CSB19_01270 [Clostridiales bacterium]|nr:MAG: hypothetical protein CSB19_01270 [Clostridiales bacterium]